MARSGVNQLATFLEKLWRTLDPRRHQERKSARQKRYAERRTPHPHDHPGSQTQGHGEYGGGASGSAP